MSEEPTVAIADANFTLVCSDGKKIRVNREKLCAFSLVFKDILGIPVNPETEGSDSNSCGLTENSTEILLLLKVVEEEHERDWQWNDMKTLVRLGQKYEMWPVLICVKLDLAKHILGNWTEAVESYEVAASLKDVVLARSALSYGERVKSELSKEYRAGWKWRGNAYLKLRASTVQNVFLSASRHIHDGNRVCEKHTVDESLLLRAMTLASAHPGYTPVELFLKVMDQSKLECLNCHRAVIGIIERLQEEWPEAESQWRESF